jgi:hypothetical protein
VAHCLSSRSTKVNLLSNLGPVLLLIGLGYWAFGRGRSALRPSTSGRVPLLGLWTSRSRRCPKRQDAEMSIFQGRSTAYVKLPNKAKRQSVQFDGPPPTLFKLEGLRELYE